MATANLGDAEFTLGSCGACAREALAHVHLDDEDQEVHLCVHCDLPLDDLRTVSAAELEDAGYGLVEARACGNGGGCSSGGCGMRRPEPPA